MAVADPDSKGKNGPILCILVFILCIIVFVVLSGPGLFGKYRPAAAKAACISNMKTIQCAYEQCKLSGRAQTKENIYGPQGYAKEEPVCPLGGAYKVELDEDGNVAVTCPHESEGHRLERIK